MLQQTNVSNSRFYSHLGHKCVCKLLILRRTSQLCLGSLSGWNRWFFAKYNFSVLFSGAKWGLFCFGFFFLPALLDRCNLRISQLCLINGHCKWHCSSVVQHKVAETNSRAGNLFIFYFLFALCYMCREMHRFCFQFCFWLSTNMKTRW